MKLRGSVARQPRGNRKSSFIGTGEREMDEAPRWCPPCPSAEKISRAAKRVSLSQLGGCEEAAASTRSYTATRKFGKSWRALRKKTSLVEAVLSDAGMSDDIPRRNERAMAGSKKKKAAL